MLTLQALMYIEENNRTGRPISTYATRTLTSWKECLIELRYLSQLWGSVINS